jgi:hypothetical protein
LFFVLQTASLTLPRTQSLKKPSTGETSSSLAVGAGAASTMSSSNDVVAKDDKVSIGGANSNTSVYDNVQSSASCPSSSSTLAAKRNVAAYATLRGQTAAVSTATPVVANEADVVVVNDVAVATSASTGSAAQTLTAMSATGDGGQSNCGVTATAIESKSSETQTVTTQTTQTPVVAVASVTDQTPAAVQSITHRTTQQQQQPLPPPNTTQPPVYPHQYPPPPFQQPQPIYGGGQPNYYNQMQQGAIPRTYPQQQQQQQQQQQRPPPMVAY